MDCHELRLFRLTIYCQFGIIAYVNWENRDVLDNKKVVL